MFQYSVEGRKAQNKQTKSSTTSNIKKTNKQQTNKTRHCKGQEILCFSSVSNHLVFHFGVNRF